MAGYTEAQLDPVGTPVAPSAGVSESALDPQSATKPSWASRILRAPFEQLEPPFMRESETGKTIADVGAKSVLPMAGMAAGSILGPIGEAGGSFGGTALNQVLGIEEPSKTQLGLSLVAPKAGQMVGELGEAGIKWLGKSVAGRDIMHGAAERLLQKMMGLKEKGADLFKQARELNFFVPAIKTPKIVDDVLFKTLKRFPTEVKDEIINATSRLREYFQAPEGTIQAFHINQLIEEEQGFEEVAKRALKEGKTQLYHTMQDIRGALLDDLENSGGGIVKEASRAYRKEKALDAVVEQLGKPHPEIKIANWLKKDPLHAKAFSAPELAQIDRIAEKLAHISASGGSGEFGQAIRGGAGFAVAGWPGVIAGLGGPGAIRKLLGTQFGRNFTERILSGERMVTPQALSALAVFARGMSAQPPKEAEAAAPAPTSAAAEY